MESNWLTIEHEGQRVILKKCSEEAEGEIIIPDGVTDIADNAFNGCQKVSNVILPNSLETIGSGAFTFSGMTSIHIPASVKEIVQRPACPDGFAPFPFYCNSLISITVDPNNRYYDSREDCNAIIETATNRLITASSKTFIPQSVKIIGNCAFSCSGHNRIDIPNSVEKIESFAFYYCVNLQTAYLPKSVKSMGNLAFREDCTIIRKESSMDVVDYWKQYIETHNAFSLNRDEFREGLISCVPDWKNQIRDRSLWPNLTGHSRYINESTLFRVILEELGIEFANFVIETEWGIRHMEACASLDYCASRIHSNWNDFSNITKRRILEFHLKNFLDCAVENHSLWSSLEDSFKNSLIGEAISCEKDYISDILLFKIWKEELHFSDSSYIYFVTNEFKYRYRDIIDTMNQDRERRDEMQNRGRIRRNARMYRIPEGWDVPLLSFGRDEEDHDDPMFMSRGLNHHRPDYHPSRKIQQIQEVLNFAGDQENLSKLRSAIMNIQDRFWF